MVKDIYLHGGFPPSLRLTRREVRYFQRELERLIESDPAAPVRVAECIALGAWRRLKSGQRNFSPQMWHEVTELVADPSGTEPLPLDPEVRELTTDEAWELAQRSMVLHINLATGRFRYFDARQNIHGLLISEGILGMLEYGRRRFAGAPMLGYINTASR